MHIEMKDEKTVCIKVVTFGSYISSSSSSVYKGSVAVQVRGQEAVRGQCECYGEGVASTAMQSRQINGCVVGNLHHSKQ